MFCLPPIGCQEKPEAAIALAVKARHRAMTSQPANPLDNAKAIAQWGKETRATIGLLIDQFIRPTAQQTLANSVSLAETRAICDSNARSIAAEGDKVRELRESVEILRKSSDDTAAEASERDKTVNNHSISITALREAAIADRTEFREALAADRAKSDERFEAMQRENAQQLAEIRALGEQTRALLSALAATNRRVGDLEQAG